MTISRPSSGFAESNAIPVNRSEQEALSPALRDLADLLAEIVARRLLASPVKLPNEKGGTG